MELNTGKESSHFFRSLLFFEKRTSFLRERAKPKHFEKSDAQCYIVNQKSTRVLERKKNVKEK